MRWGGGRQVDFGFPITHSMNRRPIWFREVRSGSLRTGEEPRWDSLLRKHRYLGFGNSCGQRLHQVAVQGAAGRPCSSGMSRRSTVMSGTAGLAGHGVASDCSESATSRAF